MICHPAEGEDTAEILVSLLADAGFESFVDMIIVPRSTVFGDDLYALIFSRHWFSPLVFFFGLFFCLWLIWFGPIG